MKTELVTNLKRQATKILSELHETKEAVMITEHGKPSAYLLDVDDYEMLQRRLNLLETIARGEQAIVDGRVKNHEDAREQMAKWLK
ncbi:MAG: type II toxin-antitoxin system Phd/YefM family antitoxin [Pseudomonadota bacterium]